VEQRSPPSPTAQAQVSFRILLTWRRLGTCSRWFLARLIFDPEDWGDTFLRNVSSYTDYTALYPRTWAIFDDLNDTQRAEFHGSAGPHVNNTYDAHLAWQIIFHCKTASPPEEEKFTSRVESLCSNYMERPMCPVK
jgi:hypothetical protein